MFIDQLGNQIEIITPPKRIISIVPSQTELLFYLGLSDSIVGVTKFCIHPKEYFKTKTFVGGTKQLNFDLLHSLKPDLIIANKEENTLSDILELQKHYPVWISDVNNLPDALEMIISIGIITDSEIKSQNLATEIKTKFDNLSNPQKSSTAYLIWNEPMMVVANNTFINDMLSYAGFSNVFKNKERYPVVTEKDLLELKPAFILLSTEPYPFKEKHKTDFEKTFPDSKIIIVDGEMFSWYGNRLLLSADYFKKLNFSISNTVTQKKK